MSEPRSGEYDKKALAQTKKHLVQEITEEIEDISAKLSVINQNLGEVLSGNSEFTAFAELWSEYTQNISSARAEHNNTTQQ